MYRSSNPEAPVWNKTIASLMGNVVYSSRFLLHPFREMNNMPDKLVKQIPELVKCSPALILAGRESRRVTIFLFHQYGWSQELTD